MRWFIFCVFVISLSANNAIANEEMNATSMTSIGMQRLSLEKTIHMKIASVLDAIITKDAYTIDIMLESSDPQRPLWYKRDGDDGGNANDAKKKNSENNLDDNKDKNNDGKIKFVDDSLPVDEGNAIIFDKLGIEAPLIDDYNDFQPDGKITFTMGKKATEKKKVAYVDQLWKFQNANDIFKNLQKVDIVVALSTSLSPEVRNKIEGYVKRINFNLGEIKPSLKFNYILLGKDLKKANWADKIWNLFELLGKYATFLGLIFSMLLFAFVGNKLIEKYFSMIDDSSSSDAMNIDMNAPEKDDEEESDKEQGVGSGAGEAVGSGLVGFDGLKRFREYHSISSAEAIILIKRWIAEYTEQGKKSLKALVQRMEMKELEGLFTELGTSEKKKWQSLMSEPLNAQDLAIANDYISNQIVQNIILPSFLDDKEVFEMIYQLTPEQVVELISNNPKAGAALINVLNTSFVMDVFKKCPADLKIGLVNQAMKLNPEDIKATQKDLKLELTKFVKQQADVPFFDKIALLIPSSLDIAFERHLYGLLASEKAFALVGELSKKYFPAGLISSLPETMVKELLQNYPLESKVHLFLTLDESIADELMAIFAPAGTKAHDMLHMEFENIKSKEQEYQRILATKEACWTEFVGYIRKKIKDNKAYSDQVQGITSEWVDELFNSGAKGNLKLAS